MQPKSALHGYSLKRARGHSALDQECKFSGFQDRLTTPFMAKNVR